RDKGHFLRMFAEVTDAQARITPENAVIEIDRLIVTAWRRKLPVYLELPSDIAYLEIDVPDGALSLEMAFSDQANLRPCTETFLSRLEGAKSPTFLLDLDAIRFCVSAQFLELANRYSTSIATLNCAKGAIPETSPHYVGTYAGKGSAPATR